MTYRFVQLSDIHFGQERGGTLVTHEDVRRKLIDDAAGLAKEAGELATALRSMLERPDFYEEWD